jgi:putative membrane protein
MMNHNLPNFSTDWNIVLFIGLSLIAFFYLKSIKNEKVSNKTNNFIVHSRKKRLFISGLILLFLVKGTPFNTVGHYLFFVHMIQQSIIYLAVPPLLLYGTPISWVKGIRKNKYVKGAIWLLTRPIIAILLFNVLFSIYHIPLIFDFLMSNMLWMNVASFVLFLCSIIMWLPIISPLPNLFEIKPLYKIAYIFGMGVLLTPACALIIFSKDILYSTYMGIPRLFGVQLLDDQQAGGVVMKVMQEVIYGFIISIIFFQWVKRDRLKTKLEDEQRLEEVNSFLNR